MSNRTDTTVRIPDRTVLLNVAALVPCEIRTVQNYYNPAHKVNITARHHIARVLAEMGLDDPRAPKREPEPAPQTRPTTRTSRWANVLNSPGDDPLPDDA